MPYSFDPRNSLERVRKARDYVAGAARPFIVAFDANGIQSFVMASSRPMAMLGASETIKEFRAYVLDESDEKDGAVFAGGGRGMLLVRDEGKAQEVGAELEAKYREMTFGGSLAVAMAPYDPDDEAGSLKWIRAMQIVAKGEAVPPRASSLVELQGPLCDDCHRELGAMPSHRPEARAAGKKICERCHVMFQRGVEVRRDRSTGRTLGDLSRFNKVVALAADGNDMGALFGGLETLEQQAVASDAVAWIFLQAMERAARDHLGKGVVPLVAGGDDIKAFMGPEDLTGFVETLVEEIHRLSDELGTLGGVLEGKGARGRGLEGLGVGIGAVMAGASYPASRLVEYSNELEGRAKRHCKGKSPARSAMAFMNLSSGDELTEGGDEAMGEVAVFGVPDGWADPGSVPWDELLTKVEAFKGVPTRQRYSLLLNLQVLRESGGSDEFMNWFMYQVARHKDWRRYAKAVGVDWRDREAIAKGALPSRLVHDLARVMELRDEAARRMGLG